MIDLAPEVRAAVVHKDVVAAFVEAMRPMVADEVRKALEERAEKLLPLSKILGKSADAARKLIKRDEERGGSLHRLGTPLPNGQMVFRPDDVRAYFAQKGARK